MWGHTEWHSGIVVQLDLPSDFGLEIGWLVVLETSSQRTKLCCVLRHGTLLHIVTLYPSVRMQTIRAYPNKMLGPGGGGGAAMMKLHSLQEQLCNTPTCRVTLCWVSCDELTSHPGE